MHEGPVKRVTVNLPADLLGTAQRVSGTGITETIIEGLELLRRRQAATRAKALRGKLNLDIDLGVSRERGR
ncbi:MAG: hypothetical protein SFV15_02755 [Polyangiaceae bacterium]|nr:hypothetical protein [Polyangiaceae bacterium]